MTRVVTFYSFKGGVGRTMALVNTSFVLARNGWRVLMVDFDLEAPGMTHFFGDLVRSRPRIVQKDALDLLSHAKAALRGGQKKVAFHDLGEYTIEVPLPAAWRSKSDSEIPYFDGRLDLLPATLDPISTEVGFDAPGSYLQRMDSLNLPEVFSHGGPGQNLGRQVREYFTSARFDAPGDALFTLRERVQGAYDIVMIDSRTGLNEVSGLSIGPLCDALVICCGLNRQNLEGTKYLMEAAGLLGTPDPKPFVVVAGPIPPWQGQEVRNRIEVLKHAFQVREIFQIPYHALAALSEMVFVVSEPEDPISSAYELLAPAIVGQASAEGDEQKFYRNAHFGERQAGRATIAERLMERRLPRAARAKLRGVLSLFPSALTLSCLPLHPPMERWRELRPDEVGPVSLAAAVAAYRLRSEAPFERAQRLNANEAARKSLKIRLDFFRFMVLGELPAQEDVDKLIERSQPILTKPIDTWLNCSWPELCESLDLLVSCIQFLGHEPLREASLRRKLIEKLHELARNEAIARRIFPFRIQSPAVWSQMFALLAGRSREEELSAKERHELCRLIAKARPIEPLPELMKEPANLWISLGDRVPVNLLHFDLDTHSSMVLGSWPELLMVSALALVRGESATTAEQLGWLALARWNYGFAWRVLVNWEHIRSLEEDPMFKVLLAEENEEIDAVELAIDRGSYPL
ncbi:MAG TPA: AAA family ATPase [Thermoanaerobaculia bacterium]|nr:AAA family ATPase [Thermoanaerobaculia bacterium]